MLAFIFYFMRHGKSKIIYTYNIYNICIHFMNDLCLFCLTVMLFNNSRVSKTRSLFYSFWNVWFEFDSLNNMFLTQNIFYFNSIDNMQINRSLEISISVEHIFLYLYFFNFSQRFLKLLGVSWLLNIIFLCFC